MSDYTNDPYSVANLQKTTARRLTDGRPSVRGSSTPEGGAVPNLVKAIASALRSGARPQAGDMETMRERQLRDLGQ